MTDRIASSTKSHFIRENDILAMDFACITCITHIERLGVIVLEQDLHQIVCDEHDGVIITHQCFFGKPSLKVSGPQSLKSWVHLRHPRHSCIGSGWCLVRLGMVDDTPCCPMMMRKISPPAAAAASSNFTSFSSQTKPLISGFHHCFTHSLCPCLWCCNPRSLIYQSLLSASSSSTVAVHRSKN